MEIKNTYPTIEKKKITRRDIINFTKWLFFFASITVITINFLVGGKAWSVIVVFSMWILFRQLVFPDMVEYNFVNQIIKFSINSSILLVLIDLLLQPGWIINVLPHIFTGIFVLVGTLFFTDLERQKKNLLFTAFIAICALISSLIYLIVEGLKGNWTVSVLFVTSVVYLVTAYIKLRFDFVKMVKGYFSVK